MNYSDLQNLVFDKTNGICHLCGEPLNFYNDFDIDHNIPKSFGGSDELSNLYPVHVYCNRSKGNQSSTSIRRRNGITMKGIYKDDNSNGWVLLAVVFGFAFLAKHLQNVRQQQEIERKMNFESLLQQIREINKSIKRL